MDQLCIHTHMRTYVNTYFIQHTYVHACIHACMRAYMHENIHVCTDVPMVTHTNTPTVPHAYLLAYIPTYIHSYPAVYILAYLHTLVHTYVVSSVRTFIHILSCRKGKVHTCACRHIWFMYTKLCRFFCITKFLHMYADAHTHSNMFICAHTFRRTCVYARARACVCVCTGACLYTHVSWNFAVLCALNIFVSFVSVNSLMPSVNWGFPQGKCKAAFYANPQDSTKESFLVESGLRESLSRVI